MTTLRRCLPLVALALVAACDNDPIAPSLSDTPAFDVRTAESRAHGVSLVNWNIYIGADVDAVVAALATPDDTDDVPALLAAIATLQATDFPTRAAAIAEAIARARPHVVGLQEVWEVAIDLTPLGFPVNIQQDFLAIVRAELAARGVSYDVAAINTNTDAAPLPGIRVVDHDVLLVDPSRVAVLSSVAANFAANIGVVAPGVEIKRGWVSVEAEIGGVSYTIVNTHLESGHSAALSGLRALQAQELAAAIGAAPRVILMGDLNDLPGSPMHRVLLGAGLIDLWDALRPATDGFTCCHASDLSNTVAELSQRIDYVMSRSVSQGAASLGSRIERLGEVPADRLEGPLHLIWPSDHVGLAAQLLEPPAVGVR